MIIIFCHIFYTDGWMVICPYLKNITSNFKLLVNISIENQHKYEIYNDIKKEYNDAIIIFTTNIGKDIGGKLALIDLCLQLGIQAEYYVFLHDKKSPHSALGSMWQQKLYRIMEFEYVNKIKGIFGNKTSVGIVASKEFVNNEYDKETNDFVCNNNSILKSLIREFDLKLDCYNFIGGTMFWIRSSIINTFFLRYPPLEIRAKLEKGNVLDNEKGTITHAWERMLSWIAIDQGYYIKGI